MDYHMDEPKLRPPSTDLWFFSYLPWSLYNGLSTPLIPLLALLLYRDNSPLIVAAVVAASTLTEVPFTIFWGNISDRIRHRKYFVVASFVTTGAVLLAMPFAPNLSDYLLLNVLEGVCSAASAPIGTMLLLETRRKVWWPRDVGTFGLVSGIGTAVGLALGGLWLAFLTVGSSSQGPIQAMQALLLICGAFALLSGGLAARWIEEPVEHLERNLVDMGFRMHKGMVERVRGFRRRILHVVSLVRGETIPIPRSEILFLAALFIVSFGSQSFYGTFVFFLVAPSGASLSQAMVFFVFLSSAVASTTLFHHTGVMVERYSPKTVLIATVVGRALFIPLFLLLGGLPGGRSALLAGGMISLNAVMGVLWAYSSTASTIFLLRLLKRNETRGKALGLYNAVVGFGGLIGTLFGGWLYSGYDSEVAYLVAALLILVGGLMFLPIRLHLNPYRHRGLPLKGAGTGERPDSQGIKQWSLERELAE